MSPTPSLAAHLYDEEPQEDVLSALRFWYEHEARGHLPCNGYGCLSCLLVLTLERAIAEIVRLRAEVQ